MPPAAMRLGGGVSTPLIAAIGHLEETEASLVTQLEATRAALSALRQVRGASAQPERRQAPSDRRRKARVGRQKTDRRRRAGRELTEEDLRKVLRKGPVSPGELWAALNIPPHVGRYQLRPFLDRGWVVLTGATTGRRIALAGGASAKEAP